MSKLKAFGKGTDEGTYEMGYTLPILISHLESLKEGEELTFRPKTAIWGPKWKRLELVERSIELLNQAIEMGNE